MTAVDHEHKRAAEQELRRRLADAGADNPEREAARLARSVDARPDLDVDAVIAQRARGVPLGMILGTEEFMGIELEVAAGALVPREETELLGRTAVARLQELEPGRAPRVIDMCCGSGNLAVAIAVHVPAARVWAADLTEPCVALARRNAARAGVADRVEVVQGDLFEPLRDRGLEGTIDLVVCNPPYISTSRLEKGDRRALLDHEPREAFDGGPFGLSIQQRVVKVAADFLRPGGWLMFEFGLGQDRQMTALFRRARVYDHIATVPDPDGNPRVAVASKKPL